MTRRAALIWELSAASETMRPCQIASIKLVLAHDPVAVAESEVNEQVEHLRLDVDSRAGRAATPAAPRRSRSPRSESPKLPPSAELVPPRHGAPVRASGFASRSKACPGPAATRFVRPYERHSGEGFRVCDGYHRCTGKPERCPLSSV